MFTQYEDMISIGLAGRSYNSVCIAMLYCDCSPRFMCTCQSRYVAEQNFGWNRCNKLGYYALSNHEYA